MDYVQFDPDIFVVKSSALKVVRSGRINDLDRPI